MLRGKITSPNASEWIVADVGMGWRSESLTLLIDVAMVLSERD